MGCSNCNAEEGNQDVAVTILTVYERESDRLKLDLYCDECNEWFDSIYIYNNEGD